MARWRARIGAARARVHRAVFTTTRGRVLKRWGSRPALELTTTGRRTGREVRTMLVAVVLDADRIVVAASDGGADRHPAWYLNLCANPEAEVLMGGRRRRVTARTAGPEERRRLWSQVVQNSPAYARYQARTEREIPLVVLS